MRQSAQSTSTNDWVKLQGRSHPEWHLLSVTGDRVLCGYDDGGFGVPNRLFASRASQPNDSCAVCDHCINQALLSDIPISAQLLGLYDTTEYRGDPRPWVREHRPEPGADFALWHWYDRGHRQDARCGHRPIPGSPLCSDDPIPEVWLNNAEYPMHICRICQLEKAKIEIIAGGPYKGVAYENSKAKYPDIAGKYAETRRKAAKMIGDALLQREGEWHVITEVLRGVERKRVVRKNGIP